MCKLLSRVVAVKSHKNGSLRTENAANFKSEAVFCTDFSSYHKAGRLGLPVQFLRQGDVVVTVRKPKAVKPGTVEKIIESPHPEVPEKAQIAVEGADPLYKEIRIENTLHDESGRKVKLKKGAHVDVIVEADAKETAPKSEND